MSGIIVDMTIINILLRNYFPKLIPYLDNKNENYGDFIGNNFINVNLINLFTNEYINKDTSLLIWDLLFIDGNIILIKAFLAIYHYLLPFILNSEQTIEEYQTIIKNNMNKLKCDDEDLIFYLIIKEYNFSEEEIDQARFSLSINTANSIKKEKEKINVRKKSFDKKEKLECNIDWPICKYNQYFDDNDVVFCLVLQKKKKNLLDNYFFDIFQEENNDKIKDLQNKMTELQQELGRVFVNTVSADHDVIGISHGKERQTRSLALADSVVIDLTVLHAYLAALTEGDRVIAAFVDSASGNAESDGAGRIDADRPASIEPAGINTDICAVFQRCRSPRSSESAPEAAAQSAAEPEARHNNTPCSASAVKQCTAGRGGAGQAHCR